MSKLREMQPNFQLNVGKGLLASKPTFLTEIIAI